MSNFLLFDLLLLENLFLLFHNYIFHILQTHYHYILLHIDHNYISKLQFPQILKVDQLILFGCNYKLFQQILLHFEKVVVDQHYYYLLPSLLSFQMYLNLHKNKVIFSHSYIVHFHFFHYFFLYLLFPVQLLLHLIYY